MTGSGAVLHDAGQKLDCDEQGQGGPPSDDPADDASMRSRDVGGHADGGADGQRCPGQPPGPAASPAVSEQDQGRSPRHRRRGGTRERASRSRHARRRIGACDCS
jgi:hypothetical protein